MEDGTREAISGMRILVTRPIQLATALTERLRELGAIPIVLPSIEIIPSESTELDDAIRNLASYDWVIFTSVHGVRFFLLRMAALNVPSEALRPVRVAVIGVATAAELEVAGKLPDYVPEEYLSERIVEGLGDLVGKRVLLARADIASKKIPEKLRARGSIVQEVVAYRTRMPQDWTPDSVKSIFEERIHVMTFTSPSTVRNLARMLGREALVELSRWSRVACIGPVTAEAAKRVGIHVDVVAKNHTVEGLVEAIVNEIGAQSAF